MLNKADEYIEKYDLDQSTEELFIEFEMIVRVREEFEQHLKTLPRHLRPNQMKRSKRMLEKRKLFAEWYMIKNNHRYSTDVVNDLAEITFMTTRTIEKTLKSTK